MGVLGARGKVRGLARAMRRRVLAARQGTTSAPHAGTGGAGAGAGSVAGMVEQFSRRLVAGWISVPKGTPPVQVTLNLGRLEIASTYATASPHMSGSQSVLRRADHPRARATGSQAPDGPVVHSWQLPNLPGPSEDRRNSPQEIRTFSFRVRGIWPYLKKRNRVTVRVGGAPLPIFGHGMFLTPPKDGGLSLGDLRQKLDAGYLLTQYGRIELSKKLDVVWQRKVMDLYEEVRDFLARENGYDAFLIGGTLLGAVREGGYIGHDVDFDAAYVSRHTTGPEAAAELVEIGLGLVDAGYSVECMTSNLHVHRADDRETRVDLFHVYFDDAGLFAFPWGIAGTSTVRREDWRGTEQIEFGGGRPLVPVNAEQMVEHLYGDDWRLPKPGFNWHLDRTAHAEEGNLSTELCSIVHWADLHAYAVPGEPSPFCRQLDARPDLPAVVVDIGCGDGTDALAFAARGRAVLGLDRSGPGVAAARRRADTWGVADRASFAECDVADGDRLDALLAEHLTGTDQPVLFYLRRLLCSVPEGVAVTVMRVLQSRARPGDVLAVEQLADDGVVPEKRRTPYQRPVDADALRRLVEEHGFTVDREEDADEDEVSRGRTTRVPLHRVTARR